MEKCVLRREENRVSQLKYNPTLTDIVYRPPCPNCGAEMSIARIEPVGSKADRRTFECAKCGHSEIMEVKFN